MTRWHGGRLVGSRCGGIAHRSGFPAQRRVDVADALGTRCVCFEPVRNQRRARQRRDCSRRHSGDTRRAPRVRRRAGGDFAIERRGRLGATAHEPRRRPPALLLHALRRPRANRLLRRGQRRALRGASARCCRRPLRRPDRPAVELPVVRRPRPRDHRGWWRHRRSRGYGGGAARDPNGCGARRPARSRARSRHRRFGIGAGNRPDAGRWWRPYQSYHRGPARLLSRRPRGFRRRVVRGVERLHHRRTQRSAADRQVRSSRPRRFGNGH